MKYVDTPPILAILFSKQQTPPQHLRTIQRDPPPKIGWPYYKKADQQKVSRHKGSRHKGSRQKGSNYGEGSLAFFFINIPPPP